MKGAKTAGVIEQINVGAFFHACLTDTMRDQKLRLLTETEFYLVSLLTDFTSADRFTVIGDSALALLLAEALAAGGEERVQRFKDIGDAALYRGGFFTDSLHHARLAPDYYAGLGRTAYAHLGQIMAARPAGGLFVPVYQELAHKIVPVMALLCEVSDRHRSYSDRQLIELYERWRETGEERARRILAENGMFPDPDDPQN